MVSFTDLCTPAKVYIVLTILSLFPLFFSGQIFSAVLSIVFAIVFTLLLNWICSKGYPGVAWFITLLPFIIIGVGLVAVIFGVSKVAAKASQQHPQQLQQPQQQTAPQPHNA